MKMGSIGAISSAAEYDQQVQQPLPNQGSSSRRSDERPVSEPSGSEHKTVDYGGYQPSEHRSEFESQGQSQDHRSEGQGHELKVQGQREQCNEAVHSRNGNPMLPSPDPNYNAVTHNQLILKPMEGTQPIPRPIEGTQYPVGITPSLGVPPGVDTAQIIHNVLTYQSQNFPNYQYQ